LFPNACKIRKDDSFASRQEDGVQGVKELLSTQHGLFRLTGVLATIMVTQASTGLVFPETYRDIEIIRVTWFGNDLVTLLLAVPLLLAGMASAARESGCGVLLWLGTIAYAVYNYAFMFSALLSMRSSFCTWPR
jgi:hypothetical protein